MFTLVCINGSLNRPDTIPSFLQSNMGKNALLQVDCVTPYNGTEQELIKEVCLHLNGIDPRIEVTYNATQSVSAELSKTVQQVNYLVIQVDIKQI